MPLTRNSTRVMFLVCPSSRTSCHWIHCSWHCARVCDQQYQNDMCELLRWDQGYWKEGLKCCTAIDIWNACRYYSGTIFRKMELKNMAIAQFWREVVADESLLLDLWNLYGNMLQGIYW